MNPNRPPQSWPRKFQVAFRGIWVAVRAEQSFHVHVPLAIIVCLLAAYFRFDSVRWSLLLLCMAGVVTAELLNSAIERLARAIQRQEAERQETSGEVPPDNPHLRDALDMASGAVLLFSIAAAVIGATLFLPEIWLWVFPADNG